MVKMHNLRRSSSDVKADKAASGNKNGEPTSYVAPEDEGARFELEHHHLVKMGLGGNLKSGDEMEFHGKGTVEKSETRSSPEGDRHSATVRFHKGGIDDSGAKAVTRETEGKGLRSELEKVHGKSEAASGDKVPEKASK